MKAIIPARTLNFSLSLRAAFVLLIVGALAIGALAFASLSSGAGSGAAVAPPRGSAPPSNKAATSTQPAANAASADNRAAAPASQAASGNATGPAPQTLTIDPKKPTVGVEVRATAQGLPPNKSVELKWKTQQGGWVIEDYYHFKGKKFTETSVSLGRAVVGADGRLDTRFTIPEDFGGVHDVLVVADGATIAQGGVEVVQTFEMSPQSGPVGTVVEIRGKGLGWRTTENTWVVNWDNQEIGFVTAVDTHGTALARFRATGPVGDHVVKLYSGYMGQSYLNYEQAPNAYLPRPQFTFHMTAGSSAPLTYAEQYQPQPVPASDSTIGAHLGINPTQGPVQTKATLRGDGFPANSAVSLVWETWAGSRISQSGFDQKETPLGDLKIDANGKVEAPITIPDDLGGLHALVLKAGDKALATTYFVIETNIVSISPQSGPVGTKVTIHLKGVGWTEYDNIYVATYDNSYMGYLCGFNSHGDVVVNLTAAGEPGIHLIDLYPGIYQGPPDAPQQMYRLPQLTYATDHPGNKIPALRFGFEVTK